MPNIDPEKEAKAEEIAIRSGFKRRPLITQSQYHHLSPIAQGFTQYWQGAHPGSELKDLANPYQPGSEEHKQWDHGQALAVQAAQDSEE